MSVVVDVVVVSVDAAAVGSGDACVVTATGVAVAGIALILGSSCCPCSFTI